MIKPRHNRTEPRSWWSLFIAIGGIFVIGLAIGLLVFTWISISNYRSAEIFERDGVVAEAVVINKRSVRRDDDTDYYVKFSYVVDDTTIERERSVQSGFYNRMRIGSETPIRYLPEQPRRMEYYVGEKRESAQILQIVAGCLGLVGLFFLWRFGSRTNSAILARRTGYRTTATILGFVDRKKSGKPTGRGYMIFETDDGKRSESLDQRIYKLRRLGKDSKIVVFVRGDDVWWEGDTGPREKVSREFPKVSDD